MFLLCFCPLSREGNSGLHSTPSNYSRFFSTRVPPCTVHAHGWARSASSRPVCPRWDEDDKGRDCLILGRDGVPWRRPRRPSATDTQKCAMGQILVLNSRRELCRFMCTVGSREIRLAWQCTPAKFAIQNTAKC